MKRGGIKKGYIMGKPDTDEVWQQLDDVIDHVYRFKDGKRAADLNHLRGLRRPLHPRGIHTLP